MEHPEIETLNKSISEWIKKNFVKALIPFHVSKDEFEFVRVLYIPKVWKEEDYWTVEARIEFALGAGKTTTIVYQIDINGNIIGYHVPKMSDIW